jgi:hypothetical protein
LVSVLDSGKIMIFNLIIKILGLGESM